jgi:hypothetical protein
MPTLQINRRRNRAEMQYEDPLRRLATRLQRFQGTPEAIWLTCFQQCFHLRVRLFPYRRSLRQKIPALRCQTQQSATPVVGIDLDRYQPAALQRFQCRSQSGAIHRQQFRDGSHTGRFRPIQRHQQGELPVGESKRLESLIEAPR